MTAPRTLRDSLLEAIDRMAGVSVLVIADLVLDEFEYGEIDRVSREAPVLILSHRRTDRLPGGGANAVHNLAALEGRPVVVGRVGRDEAGDRLPAAAAGGRPLWPSLREVLGLARGALISDYSLGLLHPGTIGPVLEAVRGARLPLFVDSRSQLRLFRGMTAATPNLQEAEAALGERVNDDLGKLARAGTLLREAIDAETIVVTRGSRGMSVFTRGVDPVHLPVYGTDEVADVTGAGDTVISVFTLAMLSGSAPHEAARLANYAGGIVVTKRGTATVSREELRRAVRTDTALDAPPRPA